MNKQELEEWVKGTELCDEFQHYDSSSNNYRSVVYKKGSDFFVLEYCNGGVCEKFGDKGYVRGVYEPIPVTLKTEVVTKEFWVDEEGNNVLPEF